MFKQNNIEGKYSIIVPIEGEDGRIRFKLNSPNDFNGNTLADVAAHLEKNVICINLLSKKIMLLTL